MDEKKEKKGRGFKDYDLMEIIFITACAILIASYGLSILIVTISAL